MVNFGTARTMAPKRFGFAAGMGGQIVLLGEPRQTSAFFTIPHAGFRLGLTDRIDAGLRLAPIPLPYATVGPGFGINLDAKVRLTPEEAKVQTSIVLGAGGGHVLIQDRTRYAYSPNAALLATVNVGEGDHLTLMARYVDLAIPTAPEGADANKVRILGASLGWKHDLTPQLALLPEIGAYWYEGRLLGLSTSGPGFQYGVMIAMTI